MLKKLIKILLVVNVVNAIAAAANVNLDTLVVNYDNVKHVPKPHQHASSSDQPQKQRRSGDFAAGNNFVSLTSVPRSESEVVVNFKDSEVSPPLMIQPDTLISQETPDSSFKYYKLWKHPSTRRFVEYYDREEQPKIEIQQIPMEGPLDGNPKFLIDESSNFYVSNANALSADEASNNGRINFTSLNFEDTARDHQQHPKFLIQQPIMVENDEITQHKDFSLFSSLPPVATSDFLKIDSSKTIHIIPSDDKSSNTRNQDLKKISDESFLNAYEKEKADRSAAARSVVSENVLTPMHVGIVLMNEDELANSVAEAENPTQRDNINYNIVDNHLSNGKDETLTTEEFLPKVGPSSLNNVKTEKDFVPSELLSQKLIQTPLARPLSFADTVQITNPPKRAVKQSSMAILFNDLFNFDDIISYLTGRNNQQPQQQQQQQQPQYQQYQSNGIGYTNYKQQLAPSSSNINAVKKPFYSKYYPTAAPVIRQTRMPKYATIPASEYQHFGYSDQVSAASIPVSTRVLADFTDPYAKYSTQFTNDNYIGPTPSSEDYWANNGVSFHDGIRFRRNMENGRSLRIEYGGFMPKISPSLEIDQNGAPLHKTQSNN